MSYIHSFDTHLYSKAHPHIIISVKIVLKGDRNVGKTCLFQRLQGDKFREEYIPTDEIQVSSLSYSTERSKMKKICLSSIPITND